MGYSVPPSKLWTIQSPRVERPWRLHQPADSASPPEILQTHRNDSGFVLALSATYPASPSSGPSVAIMVEPRSGIARMNFGEICLQTLAANVTRLPW
jgi:hypothetical protein